MTSSTKERILSQLIEIERALGLVSRGIGHDESERTHALIGLGLLLRMGSEQSEQNIDLAKILDAGRSGVVPAIMNFLGRYGERPLACIHEVEALIFEEMSQFGDERIRMMLTRMMRMDLSTATGTSFSLVGEAFRSLIMGQNPEGSGYGSVQELMIRLASKLGREGGNIADPFFGVGKLAFGVADQLASAFANAPKVDGQEINRNSWLLANLLGAVYGFDYRLECGDTFLDPRLLGADGLERYDLVVSEPPMGMRAPSELGQPDRFKRFQESSPSSEIMALQHIVSTLGPEGRAVVLTGASTLFSKGAGTRVRRSWIRQDILEGVIALPAGLWQPITSLPPVILVFNRKKSEEKSGLFQFVQVEGEPFLRTLPRARGKKILTQEGIDLLVEGFCSNGKFATSPVSYEAAIRYFLDEPEDMEDLESSGYDLSPQRFQTLNRVDNQQYMATWIIPPLLQKTAGRQKRAEEELDRLLATHFNCDLHREIPEPIWDLDDEELNFDWKILIKRLSND